MPSKRIVVERGSRSQPKGYMASTYEMLTSSENAAVVRSFGLFGVSRILCAYIPSQLTSSKAAVAFLHSSWAEYLLPPYVTPES